jgi:hypothetical protein
VTAQVTPFRTAKQSSTLNQATGAILAAAFSRRLQFWAKSRKILADRSGALEEQDES